MNRYFYKAKNKTGELVDGSINANNLADAAKKLEKRGYIVLEINEEVGLTRSTVRNVGKITPETVFTLIEKKEFFNAFYFQYKSGLSILEIFKAIFASSKNPNIRALCFHVLTKIEKGCTLSEAFERYTNSLGVAFTKLICAGEQTGKLDNVLSNIIEHIKKQEAYKEKIISSLTYPAILLVMAVSVMILFNSFVFKVFDSMADGVTSCLIAKLAITAVIQIIIFLAIVFGIFFYLKFNERARSKVLNFVSNIKLISVFIKDYYFQNFYVVLALAYEAGVPAVESVSLANTVMQLNEIKNKIAKSVQMINQGCKITTAFGVANVFSEYAISQVSAGENAGELDKMFKTIAFDYEQRLTGRIKLFTKLLEPGILVFMAIFIAHILINAYNKYYNGLFSMF